MTISAVLNRIAYSGDSVTASFSYPYKFLTDSDLVVVLRTSAGVETTKTLDLHYTVSGEGVSTGGTVTTLFTPATGETLIIYVDPTVDQTLDLVENDADPAESNEATLDKLILICQRLKNRMDRAVRITDGYTATFDAKLPAVLTANTVLAIDSSGTGITLGPTVDDLGVVPSDVTIDRFSGTGAATAFTLSVAPTSENFTYVFVAGVYTQKNVYSVAGTTLTFAVAPASGTNNIEVITISELVIGVPADATVTQAKLGVDLMTSIILHTQVFG